jgi:hypothetical protein
MRVCLYHILEGVEGIDKEYRFVICDCFLLACVLSAGVEVPCNL